MNDAQIHLALNHIPLLGTLFGTVLLIFGVIRRNKTLIHTGYITLIIVALFTIPVANSGEGAEDIVEEFGVRHEAIEAHESMAGVAIWLMLALGALSIAGLVLSSRHHKATRLLTIITLIFGVFVYIYMGRVAAAGGEIRHTELREETADTP